MIATLLLAVAVPCSAQLGVIMGLLAGSPAGLAVWLTVVIGSALVVGTAAARVLPGEGSDRWARFDRGWGASASLVALTGLEGQGHILNAVGDEVQPQQLHRHQG